MSPRTATWYARRLSRMSASEVGWRAADMARRRAWASEQVLPGSPAGPVPPGNRVFGRELTPDVRDLVGERGCKAIVEAAEAVMEGRWTVLGVSRPDLLDPDWFWDPVTGRRAPSRTFSFAVDHRSEEVTGNVKHLWELSRLHHLTVLAAGFAVSGDERYADVVAAQLRSWWDANTFLSGVHWTSGIELGVRLINWVWIRRLLGTWGPVADLFEANPSALRQIHWHQRYLAAFRSRGSSANNHVVAESAGQLTAALAFPWFEESPYWAATAARILEGELAHNTFPSGVNRELASDYHGFVTELALVAGLEADGIGRPLGDLTWQEIGRSVDAAAALVDAAGRPPRQGDGDEGRALVLGATTGGAWSTVLAAGAAVFGPLPWWPEIPDDPAARILAAVGVTHRLLDRPKGRPDHFADAGITVLRSDDVLPELWCRCDAGPHGFLSIAAHAHADALSVEVRHDGVDVLADPGTYCYHGDAAWRQYFRSTLGHNTLELGGISQSSEGGPFMWSGHARSRLLGVALDPGSDLVTWSAEHDGYRRLATPATHRRTVRLDRRERRLDIRDTVDCDRPVPARLTYHLGPTVAAALMKEGAELSWLGRDGEEKRATLLLPAGLRWSLHRADLDPILGWYSPRFGERLPSWTLLGEGAVASELVTTFWFGRQRGDAASGVYP